VAGPMIPERIALEKGFGATGRTDCADCEAMAL
jgi:hypothetical protein